MKQYVIVYKDGKIETIVAVDILDLIDSVMKPKEVLNTISITEIPIH